MASVVLIGVKGGSLEKRRLQKLVEVLGLSHRNFPGKRVMTVETDISTQQRYL